MLKKLCQMGNEQSKKPPTIQALTNACVPMRLPFTNASPPEKLWNHDPNDVDQVYPNIYISGGAFAHNLEGIEKKKITHVLNTAQGTTYMHVDTDENTYKDDVTFLGIQANDSSVYDLSTHFDECSEFIDKAVKSGGKVLVHCRQGFSRSPTIVAVYLMKKKGMTATRALATIASKRKICPNDGFMKSLIKLDTELFHPDLIKPSSSEENENSNGELLNKETLIKSEAAPVLTIEVNDSEESPSSKHELEPSPSPGSATKM